MLARSRVCEVVSWQYLRYRVSIDSSSKSSLFLPRTLIVPRNCLAQHIHRILLWGYCASGPSRPGGKLAVLPVSLISPCYGFRFLINACNANSWLSLQIKLKIEGRASLNSWICTMRASVAFARCVDIHGRCMLCCIATVALIDSCCWILLLQAMRNS